MAINVNAASASALATLADAKASSVFPPNRLHSNLSFALCPKPKGASGMRCNVTAKAQLNKVGEAAAALDSKSGVPGKGVGNEKPESDSSTGAMASQESISEFITQVSNLVKLVDSRDIVELKMKQLDCELLIRKKEAIASLVPPAPVHMVQAPPQQSVAPQVAAPAPAPAPTPTQAPSAPSPVSPPSAPKPSKSSLPSIKSPMAGTFYRSPAPGAPPFVKVGDKVQKGQVLCIVEAMKLMNEIEADQSGTIVEIIAEDAKPVSFDTPLFAIQP